MCISKGNRCILHICVINVKCPCSILRPGEVCTDANDANTDADTNDARQQSMAV